MQDLNVFLMLARESESSLFPFEMKNLSSAYCSVYLFLSSKISINFVLRSGLYLYLHMG